MGWLDLAGSDVLNRDNNLVGQFGGNCTEIGQMLLKYFEIIQCKSSVKEKQELSHFFSKYVQSGILT